jgi:ligand-binding sensor domain-containing protein
MSGAPHELYLKTREGNYYKFAGAAASQYAGLPVIDDYNQKWYVVPHIGLAVYDDNETPTNPNDDRYTSVPTSLVSSTVNVLVKDKDGSLWFGTTDGIGVINCPGQMIQGGCQVDRPIVQYDQFAGYLFQNENVRALAVDGANRKWVGTTNGVWLVSSTGDKIVYRFTVDNSPLPSNLIQKIAVDPVTGEVYIGTAQGLVSFRSTATEGGETNSNVITFPNPVPSGYNGTIAIKGLVANADVKITDISGQLVFRTQALGGQAVWNGKDYTGRRPQSGVYLIYVTNRDGSQTFAGKMVFKE